MENFHVKLEGPHPIQLGITVVPYNGHHPEHPHVGGLEITAIQQGSCIDKSGHFQKGDIIAKVNDFSLNNMPFKGAQHLLKEQLRLRHSQKLPLVLSIVRPQLQQNEAQQIQPQTEPKLCSLQVQQHQQYNNHHNHHQHQYDNSKHNYQRQHFQEHQRPIQEQTIQTIDDDPTRGQREDQQQAVNHFVNDLNDRMVLVEHRIKLIKDQDGLGFKIAATGDHNSLALYPIKVTSINPVGVASRDGRLQPGDTLLEVNGIDLSGRSHGEVTSILLRIKTNEVADILVSRLEEEQQPDETTKELEESESFVFDIPLNDTRSAGLGIRIKAPKLDNKVDLGIWVDKVLTGGAAWKDGRLRPDDQITAINGISLIGLPNAKAKETLTMAAVQGIGPDATPNSIRISILRRVESQSQDSSKSNSFSPETTASLSLDDESIDDDEAASYRRDEFAHQSMSERELAQLDIRNNTHRTPRAKEERGNQEQDQRPIRQMTMPKQYFQSNFNHSNDEQLSREPGIEFEPSPGPQKQKFRTPKMTSCANQADNSKGSVKFLPSPACCFKCRSPANCPHRHQRLDESPDIIVEERERAVDVPNDFDYHIDRNSKSNNSGTKKYLSRFFKLGSGKRKVRPSQSNDSETLDEATPTRNIDSLEVADRVRARQAAKREQEKINEHFNKLVRQHRMHNQDPNHHHDVLHVKPLSPPRGHMVPTSPRRPMR